jgi:hypothetical protein
MQNPLRRLCLLCVLFSAIASLLAQATATLLSITVTDPSGAVVPNADITVSDGGHSRAFTATTDDRGVCRIPSLPPGTYTVTAVANGFAGFHKDNVVLAPGHPVRLNVALKIDVQQQQINVSDETLDSSPDKNGSAIIIKGRDLDALADNPQDLQLQLEAMSGADPETGAQFFIDGFSGGKLPPKSSIREIRINQNPYSAQYDALGMGRIEIFTKPGTDKLHADLYVLGNNSSFNSRNPYTTTQPPYHSIDAQGDINGPLTKKISYFFGGERQSSDNQSFVNAIVLGPNFQPQPLTQAVSSPSRNLQISPRVDFQLGKIHTWTARYDFSQSKQSDTLASQFSLPSQATDTDNISHTLQLSDSQAYGETLINESRFQYIRTRNLQSSADRMPTVEVQGAFTGGGNNSGDERDNQDSYELQDYVSTSRGHHFVSFGARYRATRDANRSTGGFNGMFVFPTMTAYQITEQGLARGESPAEIRAAGGGATQFSITTGNPNIAVLMQDLGAYVEDNWKLRPSMTLSYGIRLESQTGIHDHIDAAPRLAYAWSIGPKNKPPSIVIRAGAGFFYTRFASTYLATAQRQNGITETQYVVNAPNFYPSIPPPTSLGPATSPTVYRISPLLHTPYTIQEGIGVEKNLFKNLHLSVNYQHSRGVDLLLTRNINAPLPGTYNPADPSSGIRPYGGTQNIYEYESEGASKRHRLFANLSLRTKPVTLFGLYMLSSSRANTAGAGSFPSDQYNLHVDYGRASNDVRNRVFFGGYSNLPYHFSLSPFFIYQSSSPFNITIGEDLNGDAQFNDRPAFATDLSRPTVYRTRYGNFDADPLPSQTIIPINYGRGPSYFTANLRLGRSFSFGPIVPDTTPPPPPEAAKKKAARPKKKEVQHRYSLDLGISAQNVFNYVNAARPVGVLTSPLFGKSTALTGVFESSQPGNRILYLELGFSF